MGILRGFVIILCFVLCQCNRNICNAQVDCINDIADAIYKAENSIKYPYGILRRYKNTTPRQACINTINSSLRRFNNQSEEKDFIHFLSLTYAPIGCDNDDGNNKYWERNVKFFLTDSCYLIK